MKTVVITGASTGIGRAAAEYLAGKGWKVFAGVRKHSDGEALKQASSNIHPVILDVAKPDQVKAAVETVAKALEGRTLDGLVRKKARLICGARAHIKSDHAGAPTIGPGH